MIIHCIAGHDFPAWDKRRAPAKARGAVASGVGPMVRVPARSAKTTTDGPSHLLAESSVRVDGKMFPQQVEKVPARAKRRRTALLPTFLLAGFQRIRRRSPLALHPGRRQAPRRRRWGNERPENLLLTAAENPNRGPGAVSRTPGTIHDGNVTPQRRQQLQRTSRLMAQILRREAVR